MKYGETTFDIIYLLFAIITGILLIIKSKNKMMGITTLILGLGDSFHLVPRILNYFIDKDFTIYLGIGKLVTSITMTIFYLFIYYIYLKVYKEKGNKNTTYIVWILSIIRILLCLFPQNNWLGNDSPLTWGIIRNIPFVILGIIIIILFYKNKTKEKYLSRIWLYVLLSFLFYIPVVVGAETIPLLGMLMLPKTICYMLIITCFIKYSKRMI